MLDFKTELQKYQPILEVEEVEESIHNAEIRDMIDLIQHVAELSLNANKNE